jgi:hypothetical protein
LSAKMDDDDERIFSGNGGGGSLPVAKHGNKFGRKPGIPNRNTKMLKEAIILAAECMGMPEVARNEKGEI